MTTKTKDTRTRSARDAQKRTQVKDLPKPERKLDQGDMKKVKGSIVGPCSREHRSR